MDWMNGSLSRPTSALSPAANPAITVPCASLAKRVADVGSTAGSTNDSPPIRRVPSTGRSAATPDTAVANPPISVGSDRRSISGSIAMPSSMTAITVPCPRRPWAWRALAPPSGSKRAARAASAVDPPPGRPARSAWAMSSTRRRGREMRASFFTLPGPAAATSTGRPDSGTWTATASTLSKRRVTRPPSRSAVARSAVQGRGHETISASRASGRGPRRCVCTVVPPAASTAAATISHASRRMCAPFSTVGPTAVQTPAAARANARTLEAARRRGSL